MRAVWSFWSVPHATPYLRRPWQSEFHHALSWSLSVQEARKHYPDTWLYTDDEGARFLVDQLQLPFQHVSTELNALKKEDPQWWVLGKIYTYSLQTAPFVHVDSDVFLWLPLPPRLEQADVFAHVRDDFVAGRGYLRPEQLEIPLQTDGGWLPEEWRWFRSTRRPLWHLWSGIYGGRRVDFLRYVADSALKVVRAPENVRAMASINRKQGLTHLLEEFMLVTHIDYHARRPDSPFRDIKAEFLFNSPAEATDPHKSSDSGFTHMAGGVKAMPRMAALVESHVRSRYPALFERCKLWASTGERPRKMLIV
jgi:hypothetical protein